MATVVRICVLLTLLGIADAKVWKYEAYAKGENVTVLMDGLPIKGTQMLLLHFAGFVSRQHVSNVMMYNPVKNQSDQISVNSNYTGRIDGLEIHESSLSFLLRNVNFMDSGTYTVSTMEDAVVKGNTSILVARHTVHGQYGSSMTITFPFNKTNISSILIEMVSKSQVPVVIYDVAQANCSKVGYLFINLIESCVFSGTVFSFTIRIVTWLEKGTYVAWDDMNFLLDSIFVEIEETKSSSVETINGYVALPSTVNGPTDSSTFASEKECMKIPEDQEDYVNELVDVIETNGSLSSKINISDFSSMLLVTNVMLIDQKKTTNYTGRFQMIIIRKDNLKFQLLNVTFVHNGDVLCLEDSFENIKAIISVFRRRFISQDGELGTHVLLCNNKNMYSVKTDIIQTNITAHVGVTNVTHGNCTLLIQRYTARIKGCPFSGNNPSFTFREVSWLQVTTSTAYNDSEVRLDSLYINIQSAILETRNQYQTSSSGAMFDQDPVSYNDTPEFLIFSAVVIVVVAACLAMIAVWIIRRRKVPTTTTNEIKYINSRATTTKSSGNFYKNTKDAIPPEETRLVSGPNNNAANLTDVNNGQVNVRHTEENSIHGRFHCTDSSTRTARNQFQIDSLAHLYDYIPEYHDHCWPYESKRRSSTNSTGIIPLEYDYVVQHSFMTLRPPTPDPIVTRKSKFRGTRDNSISWYKRINIKSASRLDPLTSYAEINKERHIESNCTIPSSEQGSSYLMNQLAPSNYFELECIQATGTINSLSCLRYGEGQNWSNLENLNSTNFVKKTGFSELRDTSIYRRVAPGLNYDLPRCHFDHPCSKDRRHRKSQSLDDMLAIASVRWSRRRSARSYTKNDSFDSL